MKFKQMSVIHTQRLRTKKKELFELLLGYSCNANCRFCSVDPSKRNLNSSTEELISKISKAKKDGAKYLGIGGGEPTIRKDLLTLISFAKKLKFEVIRIETNGIVLAYSTYCKDLVDAGLDFVKISIHSHKPKIHDFLTQVPGSFYKALEAIENLQKFKVRIEINTVINKLNYRLYTQFVNFFVKRGIGSFCFIYPLYTGRMAQNWHTVGINIKEVIPFLRKALDLIEALELDKSVVFNIPFCYMRGYEKMVVEDFSNMKLNSPDLVVDEVDVNVKNNKLKLIVCKDCQYNNIGCNGIWKEYLEIFGDKEFKEFANKK